MKEKKTPPRYKKNEEYNGLRTSTILTTHPAAPPEQAADRKPLKKWPYRKSYWTAMCVENTPNLKTAWLSLRPKKMKSVLSASQESATHSQWGLCNVSISANSCLFFVNPCFIVYLLCSQRPQASHQQLSSNKRVAQNKAGHDCRYKTQLAVFPVAY